MKFMKSRLPQKHQWLLLERPSVVRESHCSVGCGVSPCLSPRCCLCCLCVDARVEEGWKVLWCAEHGAWGTALDNEGSLVIRNGGGGVHPFFGSHSHEAGARSGVNTAQRALPLKHDASSTTNIKFERTSCPSTPPLPAGLEQNIQLCVLRFHLWRVFFCTFNFIW